MSSQKKEVLKTKICCSCRLEKSTTSFYVNNSLPSGFDARCKLCRNSGYRCRKEKTSKKSLPTGITRKKDSPMLWNVRKEDWIDTYRFLEKMGYDLNKNIHEQFCELHNLRPRTRMYEKSIQYSPKDLGLV